MALPVSSARERFLQTSRNRLGDELEPERVIAPGGRLVSESDRRSPLAIDLPILFERRYGDTLIRIHTA